MIRLCGSTFPTFPLLSRNRVSEEEYSTHPIEKRMRCTSVKVVKRIKDRKSSILTADFENIMSI